MNSYLTISLKQILMTSIDNKDIVLDKQLLENCLKELGALLKKKGGHHRFAMS